MKQTLLLVEDDKNLADGLLVSLEQAGYECLHAELISEVEQYWEKSGFSYLRQTTSRWRFCSTLSELEKNERCSRHTVNGFSYS